MSGDGACDIHNGTETTESVGCCLLSSAVIFCRFVELCLWHGMPLQ